MVATMGPCFLLVKWTAFNNHMGMCKLPEGVALVWNGAGFTTESTRYRPFDQIPEPERPF